MKALRFPKFSSQLKFFAVFFAGSVVSSTFEWLQPITTVEITNSSDLTIDRIDVEFHGNGKFQGEIGHGLAPGKAMVFKWITDGEASYRLAANFSDGTGIVGGAGYTERGRTTEEAISKDKVMSTVSYFPFMGNTSDTTDRALNTKWHQFGKQHEN